MYIRSKILLFSIVQTHPQTKIIFGLIQKYIRLLFSKNELENLKFFFAIKVMMYISPVQNKIFFLEKRMNIAFVCLEHAGWQKNIFKFF